jgi:citrate lyase subunit beta/citryl-CoA lyase
MMFRSLIFVPSNIKRFINKAKVVNADIICFDLEDSVPVNEKAVARQTIMEALTQRTEYKSNIYIRINSFESGLAPLDLNAIIRKGIDGIVIPKVNDEIEFSTLVDLISTLEQKRGIEKNSIKIAAIY